MSNMLKFAVLATALAAAFPVAAQQSAQEGNWLIRARAVNVDTTHSSTGYAPLGVPSDAIQVESKVIPELDITYFFTKNLAAELVLTVPQKFDVKVKNSAIGAFDAGHFYLLPPTLTAQWHFNPDGQFRPYVGAGFTYSDFSADRLSVPGVTGLKIDDSDFGWALQAGFDVKITNNLFFNMDVKKVQIRTDVETDAGTKISRLKVDPVLFGVGLGWRF
jgi:outer membrane protein